jgi:uncharacterized membrane protein YdbT with pleckstrin-like domain
VQLHYEHAIGSVLLPLSPAEILVDGERVYYRNSKHWFAMIQPLAETVGVLFLLTLAINGAPAALGIVVISALMMAVLLVVRWVTQRDWKWTDYMIIWVVGLILLEISPEPETMLVVVAIVLVGRLLLTLIRWAFYEERFVTDRRIIETSGLLGTRISSISLTRVTDLTLYRSVPGEFFDYGDLRVETPGQDQALDRIPFVRNPIDFHDAIVRRSTDS